MFQSNHWSLHLANDLIVLYLSNLPRRRNSSTTEHLPSPKRSQYFQFPTMSDKENFDPKNKIHIPTSESGTDHIRERTCTPKTVPNKVKSREHLKRSVSRKKHPSSPPLVPTTMRWKESDDHRLINIIQKYLNGNDDHGKIPWAKVSTEMKNRSGIACKSRWSKYIYTKSCFHSHNFSQFYLRQSHFI